MIHNQEPSTKSRVSTSGVVHSFPLSHLRVDMLQDSFELVDLRDNVHGGPEFDCEDTSEMESWVNMIIDAIFDAKYQEE